MTTTRRPRGGQPGNKNALKHGFYSKGYKSAELTDLDAMVDQGLTNEITMLRVFIRRVFLLSEEETIADAITTLSALSAASSKLAGLLRVQYLCTGSQDTSIMATIQTALTNVAKEFNLS